MWKSLAVAAEGKRRPASIESALPLIMNDIQNVLLSNPEVLGIGYIFRKIQFIQIFLLINISKRLSFSLSSHSTKTV
ncbi:MAG: hypothetical protein PWP53_2812 [Lacrimispora sp.]|nr:hypothetical protein [Lacrimispora sp.]